MKVDEILRKLKSMSDPDAVKGMTRYGINPENNLGVSVTTIRAYAREIGQDHKLAEELWNTGIRDARMVAACIDDSDQVSEEQMDRWVIDFNSWDLCDHVCGHLFDKTLCAYSKAVEWSAREEEFVKRAAFSLMAWLPVHDKKADDEQFLQFFPIIKRESIDTRNYVKKAVNWALRNIGKRNIALNKKAIETAKEIQRMDSKSAKWIASDALRELSSEKVQRRLQRK